jgi:hypothetical protein
VCKDVLNCPLGMNNGLFEDRVSHLCINFIEKKSILIRGSAIIVAVVKRSMFSGTFTDVFGVTTPFTFDAAGAIEGFWHTCKSEKNEE